MSEPLINFSVNAIAEAHELGRREGLEEAAKIAWDRGGLESERARDHAPGPSKKAAMWAAFKLRMTAYDIRARAKEPQ